MDNEQPHQELVKCVVVGDTAVGKTRLICARACNKKVSLSQLLTTHVPTVWAIDQYRIYKDVLERSWGMVDGVNVSLRLWDTFGDHDKDRRFAYGRSDVVLLCFSINNPASLRHCKLMWYPEIRKFCPNTPVLLVGCKNDLRFMYNDETYLSYFKDKSPFLRATRKTDLIMPDEARSVAKELGIYYYETSVFTYYGVIEVFENAIRAALMSRRQQRFWMANLKRIQRPLLQAPYKPPKPTTPDVQIASSTYQENMTSLWLNQLHSDLIIVTHQSVGFRTHRFILAASSNLFNRILTAEISQIGDRSSSESSVVSNFGEGTVGAFNEDTEFLLQNQQKIKEQNSSLANRNLIDHSAIESVQCDLINSNHSTAQSITVILQLTKLVSPQALHQCLQFIYTGAIDQRYSDIKELKQTAELLEFSQLHLYLSNSESSQEILNNNDETSLKVFRLRLQELCMEQALFADVVFELDDGAYPAHKPILVARCDMMKAMFCGDFRESQAKVIVFPGVREYTFHKLLCYLYTDEIPPISACRCLNLLELANRLCLPRLVNLVEMRVIEDLDRISKNDANSAIEQCLRLLEPVKLHNAHQLADWCMNHLCVNYSKLWKLSPRSVRLLHPENQEYLKEHRWPPVWYLKDLDFYQKCLMEKDKENKSSIKRAQNNTGCLCFSSKSKDSQITVESNSDVSNYIYNETSANNIYEGTF